MAVEEISRNGRTVVPLKELLRPGLKAVFIGLNPARVSVRAGHYYRGRHGLRFWHLLLEYGITPRLPRGAEDDAAFACGYGFTDLVRRPTDSLRGLTQEEQAAAVTDLRFRLSKTGDRPLIIFRYKEPYALAKKNLERRGYRVLRMPSPYTRKEIIDTMMKALKRAVQQTSST